MPLSAKTAAVRAGKLCYVCEDQPPALVDEWGGNVCQTCQKRLMDMRWLYAINPMRATEGKARKCKLS